ncbi:MAG: RidA family protein [Rhodospirillales bacterium]|nr:RidA family protein [Rhodospirillales bacterium]
MIKRHFVAKAPPPPHGVKYHHATEADGWLYVTGQLPTDPAAPASPLAEGIEAQTEQTFHNLRTIVEAAGYALSDTVFVRIYLSNFERDFDGLNRIYHRFFSDDAQVPCRTTVGVAKLARDALVEIDLVLYKAR